MDVMAPAKRILVLTGAGMSAESGIPTFRDALTGLWARYDPEELATEAAFRQHPARVFGWYAWRLALARQARPHAGYRALARLGDRYGGGLVVVTQNVDGLHRRAGSRSVVELHGSLEAFRCVDHGHRFPTEEVLRLRGGGAGELEPPRCGECGSLVRPGVVWFGEVLPEPALRRAWCEARDTDTALVVGTSSLVYPAAAIPGLAAAHGARVIEINPHRTPLSERVDLFWQAGAGDALPVLAARLCDAP